MKNKTLIEIEKWLRGYDLMIMETGGKYDGRGVVESCIILSNSYIEMGGCIDDLCHIVDTIINEYEEMQKSHEWKYFSNMMSLLNNYKNQLDSK